MLELRRSSRADVYDLFQDPPAILVPRRWRYEITERIDAQGNVVIPLEETDIDAVIAGIRDVGLDTVAVSCLFSFLNDAHERRVGERNVMATSQGTSVVVTFGGVDPRSGERYVSYESLKGGFGARPGKDGINAVASTTSNMMNTPVEMLEMAFPLRVEEYSLIPDSGGAGSWRGGLGARRVWRVLGEWVPPGGSAGASALRRDHESPAIIAAVFSPIMIVGA